jgi:bifunctional DNase/RNase
VIDARPSDAIALALRAKCPIRVAEEVLVRASDSKDAP